MAKEDKHDVTTDVLSNTRVSDLFNNNISRWWIRADISRVAAAGEGPRHDEQEERCAERRCKVSQKRQQPPTSDHFSSEAA